MFFLVFKSNNILVKCIEIKHNLWYYFFMERIKLTIQYNGKNFSGWQIQPNKRTIQGELERVLEFLMKGKVKTYASGRTDAGVSALGQVAHFDTEQQVDVKKLLVSLNGLLPEDIAVTSCEFAPKDFDARFSVKEKTYQYKFYISRFRLPLFEESAFRVNDYVNLDKMKEACKFFIGTRDYESLVSQKSGKTDFVRTIYDAKIVELGDGLFAFEVTGNGFLYNMVRIMFGTILKAGYGQIEPREIESILNSKNRSLAGKTMPAKALIMKNVSYEDVKMSKNWKYYEEIEINYWQLDNLVIKYTSIGLGVFIKTCPIIC